MFIFANENVIVGAAASRGHGEAGAVLEGRHRWQRQQRLGQIGLEFVEDRFAQPRWHTNGDQLADAADGILVLAHFLDQGDHAGGGFGIRTTHRRRLDLGQRHRRWVWDVRDHIADLFDVAEDANAFAGEEFLGHSAGGDTTDGLAGAGAAAAAVIAQAILGIEGEISVSRTIFIFNIPVILTALVGVAKQDCNGRTVRQALEDAGPDLRHVLFLALRDDFRLAWPATAQVGQQIVHAQRHSGRATINDDSVTGTVADAAGGNAKQLSKSVAWHVLILARGQSSLQRDHHVWCWLVVWQAGSVPNNKPTPLTCRSRAGWSKDDTEDRRWRNPIRHRRRRTPWLVDRPPRRGCRLCSPVIERPMWLCGNRASALRPATSVRFWPAAWIAPSNAPCHPRRRASRSISAWDLCG